MFYVLPEPFLESVPQVHIILMVVFGSVSGATRTIDPFDPQAIVTFSMSVFAATLGITKFFSVGPCRLIPYDKMNLGFFLVMVNVVCCLVGKGYMLVIAASAKGAREYGYTIGVWVLFSIVPQVVFVRILFIILLVYHLTKPSTNRVKLIWSL